MTTKQILNFIISEKARGNSFQESNIKMKIMIKGINVKAILSDEIPNDPSIITQLIEIGKEFEVDMRSIKV
jgi:hypothetical protein